MLEKQPECLTLFVGHHRCGSTLVRALLAAHKNALCSHELGRHKIYENIATGAITSAIALNYIYDKATTQAFKAEKIIDAQHKGTYDYVLTQADQHNVEELLCLADKSGPWLAAGLRNDHSFVQKIQKHLNIPIKLINVVRNPWDNIAVMRIVGQKIAMYKNRCEGIAIAKLHHDVHDLYLDELTQQPRATMNKLITFLGLPLYEKYGQIVQNLVWRKTHSRRNEHKWTDYEIGQTWKLIETYEWLHRYKFKEKT